MMLAKVSWGISNMSILCANLAGSLGNSWDQQQPEERPSGIILIALLNNSNTLASKC